MDDCKPMEHREFVRDEKGRDYAPLATFDVGSKGMWHVVGGEDDYFVLIPNMIDANLHIRHSHYRDGELPTPIKNHLATIRSGIVPPDKAAALAENKLRKEIDARNAPEEKPKKGGHGASKPPNPNSATGAGDDKGKDA